MPSKSQKQQKFFGMVDACKEGNLPNASQSVKDAAKSMTHKQIREFATTPRKGLPVRVKGKK